MNCKKCDQTAIDLSIRSLKDIPNGPKCDQRALGSAACPSKSPVIHVGGVVNNSTITKQSLSSHQVVAKLPLSIPTITDLLQKMVNPMSAKEMRQFCGQKDATHFKSNVIDPLIASGLVTMTQPDSPKSPTQRYVLTDAAQKLLS